MEVQYSYTKVILGGRSDRDIQNVTILKKLRANAIYSLHPVCEKDVC